MEDPTNNYVRQFRSSGVANQISAQVNAKYSKFKRTPLGIELGYGDISLISFLFFPFFPFLVINEEQKLINKSMKLQKTPCLN